MARRPRRSPSLLTRATDPTHNQKNGSLQPLHLARLLTLGYYVALTMMLVRVRVAAGLLAGDVNGSDPMDVGAAQRRMNVATRRELAKHPESFGLLVYLWAIACGCAAFFDREPTTTPRMRVGWAFNCLVFFRWWLDWIEVTGKAAATYFISMEMHATYVIMCQMLVMLVLLWGRWFPTLPFAPWLARDGDGGSGPCMHDGDGMGGGLGRSPSGVWGRAPVGVRGGKPRQGAGQSPAKKFLRFRPWNVRHSLHF